MIFRKPRLVRIHFQQGTDERSIEGIERRRSPVAGHYILDNPKVVQGEENTFALSGHVEVPVGDVLMRQVLPA